MKTTEMGLFPYRCSPAANSVIAAAGTDMISDHVEDGKGSQQLSMIYCNLPF